MIQQQRGRRYGGVRIGAGGSSATLGARRADPAGSCLPHPHRSGATTGYSDDVVTEAAGQVRPACIDTSRGHFAALVAEPPEPSSRPVVLLTAGFCGAKEDYCHLQPILAANGFRAVAYDRSGQNETAQIQGARAGSDLQLDGHAADVLAIIRALDCGPVHLVGHSLSGFIACAAALADPSSIATLTLLSSGPGPVGERHAEELRLLRAALGAMPLLEVYETVKAYRAQQPQGWRHPVVDAAREEFLRRRFTANDPCALLAGIQMLLSAEDRCTELRELGLPILVGFGPKEPYWGAGVQQDMAARLGARVVKIPRAGHRPQLSNPRRTAAGLLAFWAALEEDGQPEPPTRQAAPEPSR
jgi:pimeloyl-ACP methyl ester carboxylesterase